MMAAAAARRRIEYFILDCLWEVLWGKIALTTFARWQKGEGGLNTWLVEALVLEAGNMCRYTRLWHT